MHWRISFESGPLPVARSPVSVSCADPVHVVRAAVAVDRRAERVALHAAGDGARVLCVVQVESVQSVLAEQLDVIIAFVQDGAHRGLGREHRRHVEGVDGVAERLDSVRRRQGRGASGSGKGRRHSRRNGWDLPRVLVQRIEVFYFE